MSADPAPLPSADAPPTPAEPPRRPWTLLGRLAAAVREQNWFAVGLEIVIVVLGVVIGFQVTAWGQDRQRDAQEAALRAELRYDIERTREEIALRLRESKDRQAVARSILTGLEDGVPAPQRDSLLALIGNVFVTEFWKPTLDTYNEALGSGRLNLIRDSRLRLALSRYQAQNEEVEEIRGWTKEQYFGQQEPFMVANAVYAEVALDFHGNDLVQSARYRTDFEALATSRELWNLLTLRMELAIAFVGRLEALDQLAVEALARLDE